MDAALAQIFAFPLHAAELALSAMGFSADAFARATTSPEAQTAALLIAFLAGVSEMLGQSVILVINRIPLYRFIASLAFTGASYIITVVMWGLSVLAIAPLTPMGPLSFYDFVPVTSVLALAFAPRLLSVFAIAPYFGAALANLFEVWSLGLAVFALHVGPGLPMGAAVFCAGVGWAASYGLRTFFGHALAKPLGRLRLAVSGSPLEKSPQEIIDDVMTRVGERPRR